MGLYELACCLIALGFTALFIKKEKQTVKEFCAARKNNKNLRR